MGMILYLYVDNLSAQMRNKHKHQATLQRSPFMPGQHSHQPLILLLVPAPHWTLADLMEELAFLEQNDLPQCSVFDQVL